MSDTDFTGKTILVVGGSSGIGNGIAQAFRARGGRVSIWGTREAATDYQEAEGSDLAGLKYLRVDVSVAAEVEQAAAELGPVDVAVLCQGTVVYQRGEFSRPGWDRVMSVNLDSVMDCARAFHATLAAAGGTLIIVSSVSGFRANIGNPAYAASKAGAVSLTKSLGQAWARDGIRVNGIAPGLVATKLTSATVDNPERLAASLARIPQGRMGTPDEIAGAAIFLASPLASYVTGHTIVIDGGLTL